MYLDNDGKIRKYKTIGSEKHITKAYLSELAVNLRRMAFSAEDSFVYEVSDKAADFIEAIMEEYGE